MEDRVSRHPRAVVLAGSLVRPHGGGRAGCQELGVHRLRARGDGVVQKCVCAPTKVRAGLDACVRACVEGGGGAWALYLLPHVDIALRATESCVLGGRGWGGSPSLSDPQRAVGSLLEPPAGAVVRCVLWGLLCVACTRWSRALKEGRASGAAQHSSRMACNEGREWRQAAGTKRETGLGKGDMRCRGGPPPLASPLPRTSYIPAQGQGRRGLLVVPCEAHLQRGQGFAEGRGCASL